MNEIKALFKKAGVRREPMADCNNLKYTSPEGGYKIKNLSEGMFYMHILLFAFHGFVKKILELSGQTYMNSQLSLVLGIILDHCRF